MKQLALLLLLVAGLTACGGGGEAEPTATAATTATAAAHATAWPALPLPTIIPDTAASPTASPSIGHVLGDPNAPVTIYEYSDFQCPFCREAAREVVPRLETDYLVTGKAKLIFKNFAFIGRESIWGAEAAACAGDQGKFWEYHDKLFEEQKGENKEAFNVGKLKLFAQEIGLNAGDFNTCFDQGKYTAEVADETSEAKRRGIMSVPTFFVGQTEVDADYEAISKAIEDELAKHGNDDGG